MNLKRVLFFTLIFAMMTRLGLSQYKETAFGAPGDPVKVVQVFPNPAIDYLTVRMENPTIKKTRIVLLNVIGNELEFESEFIDENEIKIKVKDLPTGYYFLSVRDDQSNFRNTFKFLKR